jgi:hypothetical protein
MTAILTCLKKAEVIQIPGYGVGDREIGVRFSAEARDFSFLHLVLTGTGRPELLSSGYRGYSPA